jgi:hypothetical protein
VNKFEDISIHQPLLLMAEQRDIFVELWLYLILYYRAMLAIDEDSEIYDVF